MSLNIKNNEVERLARELARVTGETITDAIAVAARERLDRLDRRHGAVVAERAARIHEIARDAGWRWVEPQRSTDHGDLLYGDDGLPR